MSALTLLAACGGAGGGGSASSSPPATVTAENLPGSGQTAPPAAASDAQPSSADAARFLTQATFGIKSVSEINDLRAKGYPLWLWEQFNTGTMLHTSYLDQQRLRESGAKATEEMSYEAVWQQWLFGKDQLRARMAFALGEIVVISNIAPDIRPYAMSSYWDMLNRNAFGNYRQVLKDVTLHPAMGYYLNMINSEKEDTKTGAHPNENYAREVLQLFSIGLVKLNIDGTPQLDGSGKSIPTYDEATVKEFARAFTGWSYPNATKFDDAEEEVPAAWVSPMKPFPAQHDNGAKTLLNGTAIPAGQTPQKDLEDAIDNIFNHPNVGPFISRQLIQRLVTSNPSKDYIARVATVFNNDGTGVRGNLRAVVQAILLDAEARNAAAPVNFGKQREPVIRFANMLRALNAKSANGINMIHYLDSADNGLGQSPLLAPSVFNYFSPNYRAPGAIAKAGLYSPEFQITTETTAVGSLNFFADLFNNGGYGWGDSRLKLDTTELEALASTPSALTDRINALFCNYQMSSTMRSRMITMLTAMPANRSQRVKAALILTSLSPDFVVQR
ncbi:DUF1800 domain-containing protein [Viridibacterium curvum]|uniref:DUF1800 domain-containing protein n=1 Tax=Viridibacterium curvum TaxID=1101404 RepID=A0ABP9R4M2_9RHOO